MPNKVSQPETFLRYLNSLSGWVKSFNLRGVATEWGWIGSQGDKRARELAKDQGYNLDGSLKKHFRYRGQIIPSGFPCHFPHCPDPSPWLKVLSWAILDGFFLAL